MVSVAQQRIQCNRRVELLSGFPDNYFSSSLMIEEGETPSALAILKMVVMLGWRSPRSSNEMKVLSRSQSIPSCA